MKIKRFIFVWPDSCTDRQHQSFLICSRAIWICSQFWHTFLHHSHFQEAANGFTFLGKKGKHPNSNSTLTVLQKCGGKLRILQWIKYCCWIIKLVLIFCRIWPFLKSSRRSEVARLPQGKTLVYLLQGMEAANINWGCVQSPYHFSSAQLSKSTEHFLSIKNQFAYRKGKVLPFEIGKELAEVKFNRETSVNYVLLRHSEVLNV